MIKILFILLLCATNCFAWEFRVKGSYVYYDKGELDYVTVVGYGYFYDGKFNYCFRDDSDIQSVYWDLGMNQLNITKKYSKWILLLDYPSQGDVTLRMTSPEVPELEEERLKLGWQKKIY
jgi:hypothetical protein